MTPQLPSQVGFYLLPSEKSNKPNITRAWRSQNHLGAITEVSDESNSNSNDKKAEFSAAANAVLEANRNQNALPIELHNSHPKLLRKSTALPGMFDRPTRHPSLDDLRGFFARNEQNSEYKGKIAQFFLPEI